MIIANRLGRLGNNLFQYFFAKRLSEVIGVDFRTNFEIPSVFGLENKFNENKVDNNSFLKEYWHGNNCQLKFDSVLLEQELMYIISYLKNIKIEDFNIEGYFQQINYYNNWLYNIKESFKFKKNKLKNVVGVHIRKDDIYGTVNDLPDEWFLGISKKFPSHKKFLTTDSRDNQLVSQLIDDGFELYQDTPENTIIQFSSFSDLVLSQGTFSWWMGLLSDGKKHCMKSDTGWNSADSGVNILIRDNDWLYYEIKDIKYLG